MRCFHILRARQSWKIDLSWCCWYLLDDDVAEEGFVRPQEDGFGTNMGGGEEFTGEGEVDGEWGLAELDPVDETAGHDVEDLQGLVERTAEEPFAVWLGEADVGDLVVGYFWESSYFLEAVLHVQDDERKIAGGDGDQVVGSVVN